KSLPIECLKMSVTGCLKVRVIGNTLYIDFSFKEGNKRNQKTFLFEAVTLFPYTKVSCCLCQPFLTRPSEPWKRCPGERRGLP
ncbi:unnamed protein product, partial [Rangifer tarandus platyrhynchus]